MPDLLIELFSEEIPARMQARASEDLKKRVTDGLVEAGLTYAAAAAFATPRRLTLTIEDLLSKSPVKHEERRGPKVGAPDKAVQGFLRGVGLTVDQLDTTEEKKGTFYLARIETPGRCASDIIAEVLSDVIRNFPWPKSMRWGTGQLRWVRPLHRIVCILSDNNGTQIVPVTLDGITASDQTEGHRFMAPGSFAVTGFEDYQVKLKRAFVILNPTERAEAIWQTATNLAFARGLELVEDRGLLTEVAGLVEWPVVLMGDISNDFLSLPAEVLQTSMKEHQKFFSVRNPTKNQIQAFVTVANRETSDDGATILAGNQKVLAARLSDAKFFWENDLRVAKSGMDVWTDQLSNVTFHNKLGSQKDRIDRITALARALAPVTGADADLAEQAARVAKADLSSEMVYEFPELQGLMGRYYAAAAGHPAEVAAACQEHYSPLGPTDAVPTAPISIAVALADKLDTLTGFWAIDEKPTGSKDPYALRRAALGVIRLITKNNLRLPLLDTIAKAYPGADGDDLLSFFHDRLKVFLRDDGIRYDAIDAVIALPGNDDLARLAARARALAAVLSKEDGQNLVQGFKRANNILSQAEQADGVEYSYGADPKFAEDATETALFAALDHAELTIADAMNSEDYTKAMAAMATLRVPVDAFFTAIQINSDNAILRRNRLNLLSRIRSTCSQVADLTLIEG
jgi:glycyl-tRNA synthetase beta chain